MFLKEESCESQNSNNFCDFWDFEMVFLVVLQLMVHFLFFFREGDVKAFFHFREEFSVFEGKKELKK